MIIGDELRAWGDDRGRQRDGRRAAEAMAAGWARSAAHQSVQDAMANLSGQGADEVVEAIRTLFADASWVDALLGAIASEMRRDPFFIPPLRHLGSDIHSGLVVFEDMHASIAVGVTSIASLAARKDRGRRAGSIAFSGQVDLLKFVKADAVLSFWRAPVIDAGFSAATAGRCTPAGQRRIGDGTLLVVDGRCESFVIEHASSNLVVLQATVKPDQAPLRVEYDFETRAYVGCSAADDSASRIQMLATLLRTLDCDAAFPEIAAFLDHKDFFVRWHIMRELLGLDLERSLPHLRKMAARDPHPETRQTARQVLDRLEQPAPPRVAA